MRRLLLLALCLSAAPAAAQLNSFAPQDAPRLQPLQAAPVGGSGINFCVSGKFVIAAGSCRPSGRYKDVISPKACSEAAGALYDGLRTLYPNVEVEFYRGLSPAELLDKLSQPMLRGFFLIGAGTPKGGFLTGPGRKALYPEISGCTSGVVELIGAFTSHSAYSPSRPAPAKDRALVLSRSRLLYGASGAVPGSWPALCKPKLSLVYPTRTFAGRMKDDVNKFLGALMDEKARHVRKTLATICENCPGHVRAGDDLAKLCPPNSDVCGPRGITAGSEKLVLDNYCSALAPTPHRAEP